jgi:hypothetical protein
MLKLKKGNARSKLPCLVVGWCNCLRQATHQIRAKSHKQIRDY